MVAHVAGNAGGPPPPTQREAQLETQVAALQAICGDRLAKLNRIWLLLETSPFNPTRADLADTLLKIRQVVMDQETAK